MAREFWNVSTLDEFLVTVFSFTSRNSPLVITMNELTENCPTQLTKNSDTDEDRRQCPKHAYPNPSMTQTPSTRPKTGPLVMNPQHRKQRNATQRRSPHPSTTHHDQLSSKRKSNKQAFVPSSVNTPRITISQVAQTTHTSSRRRRSRRRERIIPQKSSENMTVVDPSSSFLAFLRVNNTWFGSYRCGG